MYADDTTLSLSANWNNIISLTQALSNDLENIEKWSTENKFTLTPRRLKYYMLWEKGYNISFVRKQQPENYTLIPQLSTSYHITSYWV